MKRADLYSDLYFDLYSDRRARLLGHIMAGAGSTGVDMAGHVARPLPPCHGRAWPGHDTGADRTATGTEADRTATDMEAGGTAIHAFTWHRRHEAWMAAL